MFIKMSNDRRININAIFEYKPYEKLQYYYIKIKYINGTEEDMIFDDPKKRDKFLKKLDTNLLLNFITTKDE